VRKRPKKARQPPRSKGKRKDPREFGKTLIDQLEQSVRYCRREGKIVSDEDVLFVLHTENYMHFEEQTMDRLGLKLSLQTDGYSAIISVDPVFLERLRSILGRYVETAELRSYIDEIASISLADFDRISVELKHWIDTSDEPISVEIEMLPNLGEERYVSVINNITNFLKQQNDNVLVSRVRENSASIRAYAKPQTVRKIASGVDSVWQAKKAPTIIKGRPQSIETPFEITPRSPESGAKCICVLDTGIDKNHPLLKDVFLDAVDLTRDNQPQDVDGHGTFVAGLAAYGELENRTDPSASARIISAKVLGQDLSPYPYLETYVEEATNRYHEQASIFSLSVMYPQYCNFSRPTELAYVIDRLSRDNNVLFVVCTGNLQDEELSSLRSLPYPTYLGDKCCVVYGGAESCNCITVGGVANKESDKSTAKIRQPSPFTRRGELSERGKPDIVSWAGNAERDLNTGQIKSNDKLGVVSLGLSPSILAYGIGTSYAAPIVANMLARLLKEYPEASPNLLKALLIHFAYWPEEHHRLNASNDLKKSLYGKGIPEFFKCAYSTKSCAAYVREDSVAYNEIAIIPIYVPSIMKQIYGEKIMRVTLTYDPPVDRGISGYSLVDLDFQLYKQYRIQRNWDRLHRKQWDNVKSDIFRWQKTGWGKEWSIIVYPRLRFRKKLDELGEKSQRFALVVTLEDPNKKTDVYNAILNERKTIVKTLEAYVQRRNRNAQQSS
jgi:hypothetical protein